MKVKKRKKLKVSTSWLKWSTLAHGSFVRLLGHIMVVGLRNKFLELRIVFDGGKANHGIVQYVDADGKIVSYMRFAHADTSHALATILMDLVGLNPIDLCKTQISNVSLELNLRDTFASGADVGLVLIATAMTVEPGQKVLHVLFLDNGKTCHQ